MAVITADKWNSNWGSGLRICDSAFIELSHEDHATDITSKSKSRSLKPYVWMAVITADKWFDHELQQD